MKDVSFNFHKPLHGHGPKSGGTALIRCGDMPADGGIGRMLGLARALRDGENMKVEFSLYGDCAGLFPIRGAGFEVHQAGGHEEFAASTKARKPDLLILEGCGLSRAQTEALRRDVTLMAAIEDVSDRRLACDFAYYAPLPRTGLLSWTGARAVPRIGWEWSLLSLDPRFAPVRPPGSRLTLLVTMGAAPAQLTLRAARLLSSLDSTFRIRFVIDSGMMEAGKAAAAIAAMKSNYQTVEGAIDLSTEYASADLALCAFGTAPELAAFGVPALYLAQTDEDASSASAFAAAGMGQLLGIADRIADGHILEAVRALMNDSVRRRDMRRRGLATLDGGGPARIAADLSRALVEEKAPVRVQQ